MNTESLLSSFYFLHLLAFERFLPRFLLLFSFVKKNHTPGYHTIEVFPREIF